MKVIPHHKKALFFTIDALIALSLSILLLTTYYITIKSIGVSAPSLSDHAKDTLIVLHNDLNDTAIIQEYLNTLPEHLCGSVEIFNASKQTESITTKTNCIANNESNIAWRTFQNIQDQEIMLSRASIWLK